MQCGGLASRLDKKENLKKKKRTTPSVDRGYRGVVPRGRGGGKGEEGGVNTILHPF